MSTRATYQFNDKQTKTTIYTHYDGYPEGAAEYLYLTLTNEGKGNLATRFIRTNPNAEITVSHDYHCDTDYKYTIEGNDIHGSIIGKKYSYETDKYDVVICCSLISFFELHKDSIKDYSDFRVITTEYGSSRTMNRSQAARWLERQIEHLRLWKGKYEGMANWRSCVRTAKDIIKVFPELLNPEIQSFFDQDKPSTYIKHELGQ